MVEQMRFRIQGEEYWPHIEKKLGVHGIIVKERGFVPDTRNFRWLVARIGHDEEEPLILNYIWVADWVDGNDRASEARIDAAIKQVLDRLQSF